MAIELGLDRPATTRCDEREALNRTRTWLCCIGLDRTHAANLGIPPMIRSEQFVCSSPRWYRMSTLNIQFDVHLCALVDALTVWDDFDLAVSRTLYSVAMM